MKYSDLCWLDSVAMEAMNVPASIHDTPLTTYGQAVHIFLEELCALLEDFVNGFNERVQASHPELQFQIFKMGYGKPGIILLRNRDKLVIAGENGRIHVKVVQVHAYNEKSINALDFQAVPYDQRGNMIWKDASSRQVVSPELVVKHYLGEFFIHGSQAYLAEKASAETVQPQTAG